MAEFPAVERCEQCAFDAAHWTRLDAVRTIDHAPGFVAYATEHLPASLWNTRSRADCWSIAEYVVHLREVIELNHLGAELGQTDPGTTAPELGESRFDATPARHDPGQLLGALADQARSAAAFFGSLSPKAAPPEAGADEPEAPAGDWKNGIVVRGHYWTADHFVRHICHDLMHHLGDIADIRHDLGDAVGPLDGTVDRINVSDGGVPKRAVETVDIGARGLEGDRQKTRRHHGRPWQAVCLYSADVIEEFAAEGHPIGAGDTGENVTLRGVDWTLLRAGLVVRAGDVRLRLTAPAVPCNKNSRWFTDGDHMRMSHERHPGYSRWYASVLTAGALRAGDVISIGS